MTPLFSGNAAFVVAFALTILILLALDLGVFQRTPRAPTFKESLAWTAVWLALAVMFGAGVTHQLGAEHGLAFFSAYLVEEALSVDNMLVVILIFTRFGIPQLAQRKALFAGIAGAVVMRTVLILGGTSLVARFHFITYALGAVLVVAAVQLARGGDGDGDEAPKPSLAERIARRVLPVSRSLDGTRLFTRQDGALRVTPLLVAILVIEVTDVVFALDSIPAVLGVTSDPFIALTSNLFAVLGLRSLFFVVSGLLARLRYLKTGLVLILVFVGAKMLAASVIEIPIAANLAVIATILGGAVFASLRHPATQPERTRA
jgi:tellurite resistance protein TerC